MLEKDVDYEQFCQFMQSNCIYYQNEYTLLGKPIDNDQDCIAAG